MLASRNQTGSCKPSCKKQLSAEDGVHHSVWLHFTVGCMSCGATLVQGDTNEALEASGGNSPPAFHPAPSVLEPEPTRTPNGWESEAWGCVEHLEVDPCNGEVWATEREAVTKDRLPPFVENVNITSGIMGWARGWAYGVSLLPVHFFHFHFHHPNPFRAILTKVAM